MKRFSVLVVGMLLWVSASVAADLELPLPAPVPRPSITGITLRVQAPSILGCVRVIAKPTTNGVEFGRALIDVRVDAMLSDGTPCADADTMSKMNAPVEAWNADLIAAGAELGIDWATATGANEITVASRAVLRVIGSRLITGAALDAWVAATHAALMSVVAAELGGSP